MASWEVIRGHWPKGDKVTIIMRLKVRVSE